MNKDKLCAWILLIFWMGIIFAFSHQANSGEVTQGMIENILPALKTNSLIEFLNFILRKSAHIMEYFILSLLTVFLLKKYTKNDTIIIIITIIFCSSYAITDEFHQLFIPGRTAALKDIMIDSIGAILFIFIYKLYKKYFKTKY